MVAEFKNKEIFDGLAAIIDDHIEWYGQVMLAIAFSDEPNNNNALVAPDSFSAWSDLCKVEKPFNKNLLDNIRSLHHEVNQSVEKTLQRITAGTKPEPKAAEELKTLFDAFIMRLRRLEHEQGLEDSGVDTRTNLRSPAVLIADLKKEMERVSRNGKSFSLVYARIDDFVGVDDKDEVLKRVSDNVKLCLRSFDDAYYMDHGAFLMSLKQTDTFGAQAAVMRLQQMLAKDTASKKVTMSFCIAEPVPEDNMEELLANMKDDLAKYHGEKDIVLKFLEVSPLQRYVEALG